ncbi:hypothetical protein TRSC58_03445 [Trypanosoma rangeli SC58]|uniref:Uncharacterized protein n=1 Tax=Trypanosoma rangeli SC58 TaxID=429131 RepID=A0A061J3X6_TRYRA|nr:hypothetical protein TRSC58_03445 [Trypanosoma rangeli SC58]
MTTVEDEIESTCREGIEKPATTSQASQTNIGLHTKYAPDYKEQPYKRCFLGWPSLVATWVYIIWFVSRIAVCWRRPLQKGDCSLMDLNWYYTLLVSLSPPVIFLGTYLSWIGWKFFLHN